MYSKESFELLLLAIDEGMRVPDAADFAGVKRRAAPCRRRGSTTRRIAAHSLACMYTLA